MTDQKSYPKANPSADREAQLADGVLERDHGEDYNPNSEAVVEAHRERFEAINDELRERREAMEHDILPIMDEIVEEANAAAHNPDHTAMLPHQNEHLISDPVASHAGKEHRAPMPPELHDVTPTPQPQRESTDIAHEDGPAVPVQSHSLRKDM